MYNRVSSPNGFAIEVRSILGLSASRIDLTRGFYHLHGKSGWNGTLVMVQDFHGQR